MRRQIKLLRGAIEEYGCRRISAAGWRREGGIGSTSHYHVGNRSDEQSGGVRARDSSGLRPASANLVGKNLRDLWVELADARPLRSEADFTSARQKL